MFTALILTISVSSLGAYLFNNQYLQLVLSLLLVTSAVLLINQTVIYIPVLITASVLFYYAVKKTHSKTALFTHLDVNDIFEDYFRQGFLIFVTLLSLGLGLYSIPFTPKRINLPRKVTNQFVENVFVNLDLKDKILLLDEESFKNEARSILESSEDLTEEEKKSLLRKDSEIMDELVDNRKIPGISADGVRLLIEQQINNLVQPFIKYIPLLLGILLWLTLRFFTAPVVMLAAFTTELLIKMFLKLDILRLKKETVETEKLEF